MSNILSTFAKKNLNNGNFDINIYSKTNISSLNISNTSIQKRKKQLDYLKKSF